MPIVEEPVIEEPVVDDGPFFSALSTPQVEEKKNDGLLAKILAALAVLGMLVTAWIFFWPQNQMNDNGNFFNRRPQVNERIIRDDDTQLRQRVSNLETKTRIWNHRVWLLGLANNENACLSKRIDANCHPCENNNYVFFDKNWNFVR